MYTKFIIFYTANYCQKIKSFFDVDYLLKAGLNVEFWNLSGITAHEKLSAVQSEGLKTIDISTYTELESNIKRVNQTDCLFLSFVNFAKYSIRVYRLLSKYNCNILYATSGVLPTVPVTEKKHISILKKYSLKDILDIVFFKIAIQSPFFIPAKYVLMSCNKATCDYKVADSTIYLSCNSGDYNRFFREECHTSQNQVVFIDQYTPFHNDYTLRGLKHVTADKYYQALNRFFSNIENKYDCDVVICAHPSALKYHDKDYFDGRKVYYNDTSIQVKKSIGVIAQFSTAISFPVMDKKPIILITTDEMNNLHPQFSSFERYLSEILKVPMINIDNSEKCEFEAIDSNAYNRYLIDYLTTPKMMGSFNSDVLISLAQNKYQQFIY